MATSSSSHVALVVFNTSGAITGLNYLNSALGRTRQRMSEFVAQSGYLVLALTRIATYTGIFTFFGLMAKAIKDNIELERRFAEVSTLINMANAEQARGFEEVKQQILELNPALGSAIDLTKGLYEIMSAGINEPQEAMKILVQSAKYAKAGLTDLGTSAATLTSIIKAYRLSADKARESSDYMFASVMEGKFHAEDLNEALGRVLPTAAAMGVGIDEVGAALAVLSQRGLDASEAATALNRMMISFLKPQEKSAKVMHSLGIETGITAFQSGGLLGAMRQLTTAMASHADLLPIVFTRERGLRGAFIMTGRGADEYARMLEKVRASAEGEGETERAYQKIIATTSERWKALGAHIQQTMAQSHQSMTGLKSLIGVLDVVSTTLITLSRGIVWVGLGFLGLKISTALITSLLAGLYRTLTIVFAQFEAAGGMMGRFVPAQINKQMNTLNRVIPRWEALKGVMSSVFTGLIIGAIAYQLAKLAIEAVNKALDAAIQRQIDYGNQLRARTVELKRLSQAHKEATGEIVNYSKEVENMVVVWTMWELGLMADKVDRLVFIMNKMGGAVKYSFSESRKFRDEVAELLTTMELGEPLTRRQYQILLDLGRVLGYDSKAYKTITEYSKKYSQETEYLATQQRKLNQLFVLLGNAMPYESMDAMGLATELSKDDLVKYGDAVKRALDTMKKVGTTDFNDFVKWLEASGEETGAFRKKLEEFDKQLTAARGLKYQVDLMQMAKEETNRLSAAMEELSLSDQQATARAKGLADAYAEYSKVLSDSVIANIPEVKKAVEILIANLARVPTEYQALILKLNAIAEKDKTAEIAAKKAENAREWVMDAWTRLSADLETLQNKINQDETKNIITDAKEKNALLKKDLADRLDTLGAYYAYSKVYLVLNAVFAAAMAKREQDARTASLADTMKEYAEAQQKMIQSHYDGTTQRLAIAKREYLGMMQFLMVFGYKFFPGMVGYMMTLWEKLWGNFNANLEDTRTPMQKMIERFQTLGSMISAITTNLRDMFDTFGIGESKVLDVLDAVAKGFNAIEQSLRAVEAAESAAAEEGANFIDKLNRVTSEIGLAIAVITTIISLFSKLFAGKTEAEKLADAIKDIKEEMGWLGEITDATAEKIAKLREAMGEAAVEARTLADMMKDTGINTNNYGQYLNRMIDSLNELVSAWKLAQDLGFGEFDIQQELEGLGKAFEEMIGYLQRIGKEGDAGILIFIKRLRELGITIKEVDDYVYGWLERAAKGLTDMITAVTGAGPQLEIAGNLLLSVFNAALAQGMSLLDALNLIADPLAALSAKYTELGLAGSGAIAELLKIQKVKEANEGLFEAISGLNEVLQALGNTGFLTAEDFSAMQSSVGEYFKQLTAAGLTSKEALAVLAPILANLEYYAKQYGFALDPATQALIDQAKEAGVYKEKAKTMAEVLEEGFGNICDRLDQIVKYFTGDNGILDNIDKFKKRGAWDEFNEGARDAIDNLDEVNRRMPKGPGRYDGGNGSAQFGMTNVGQTQLIKVHRGESIIPENISSVLRSFFGGMSTPAATGGQADMAQVTVEIDGMAVYKALVPIMRKGMGKYGDVEIQGGGVF